MRKVCIQGLGYVGAAMAAAVAEAREASGEPVYDVVGVDLPTSSGCARIDARFRAAVRNCAYIWHPTGFSQK